MPPSGYVKTPGCLLSTFLAPIAKVLGRHLRVGKIVAKGDGWRLLGWSVLEIWCTLPETNTSHLKITGWKMVHFLSFGGKRPIFRTENAVSLRQSKNFSPESVGQKSLNHHTLFRPETPIPNRRKRETLLFESSQWYRFLDNLKGAKTNLVDF